MDEPSTRQTILEAVVSGIEKYGIEKITVRKIAEEVGTNIASINYYFRSKQKLLEETLSMTINHMAEDVIAITEEEDKNFRIILGDVFRYLIGGAQQFPGITTAHLYSAVIKKDYESPGAAGMRRAFNYLVNRATTALPDKDPDYLRYVLAQLFYAVMFTMLAPGFLEVSEKFAVENAENRVMLAGKYADMFFAIVNQESVSQ